MGGHPYARPALTLVSALCSCWISAAAQSPPDIESVVARVGARVAEYYRRAQSLICTDVYTVLPIESDWSPDGMARTVDSELHLELTATDGEDLPDATVVRRIIRIDGRPPRDRDKTDRAGCTDPNPLSPEPLAFLLPPQRDGFQFTSIKTGKEQGRAALILDFVSTDVVKKPELVRDSTGHDDCFDWTGPLAARGRVWVDAETFDVMRVDRHLRGPVDIQVPRQLQQKYGFDRYVTLDADDLSLRYTPVAFTNPEEKVLLPASIDYTTVLRGGLQSVRRTDRFSDYRRFLTGGRVVKVVR